MPTFVTLVYHPSEKLPKVPVWTKCGLMSDSSIDDVRKLFNSLRHLVTTAETLFVSCHALYLNYKRPSSSAFRFQKTLRMDSIEISPPRLNLNTSHSNLDPYTLDTGCWKDHNVRFALFFLILCESDIINIHALRNRLESIWLHISWESLSIHSSTSAYQNLKKDWLKEETLVMPG